MSDLEPGVVLSPDTTAAMERLAQHRATPEQWACCEESAAEGGMAHACLLDLRARVEALEAKRDAEKALVLAAMKAQRQSAPTPLSLTFMVPPSNCRQRLMREGKGYPKSGCDSCGDLSPLWRQCDAVLESVAARPPIGPAPTGPAPAGSLVERVAIACAKPCNKTWDDQARAAIREVAAWLREALWEAAPDALEQEAGQ